MQPVTIEAKPTVRASDGGRSATAAASGSASFAVLLLETGTGSREPVASEPRPSTKAEATRTLPNDDSAPEAASSDEPKAEAAEDGEQPLVAAPETAPIPVPAPLPAAGQAATAAGADLAGTSLPAAPPPGGLPAPADVAQSTPLPGIGDQPAPDAAEISAQPGARVQPQPAVPASDVALPTFNDLLANAAATASDRPTMAAASANTKVRQTIDPRGIAQPGRIGEPAQSPVATQQTTQPQLQTAVDAAVRSGASDAAATQGGAGTASDLAVPSGTNRESGAGAVNALSAFGSTATPTTDTAAATPPRAALPSPAVHDQIAVHIQRAVSQGRDHITIHLSPAELGRIDVRLEMAENGRVSATVAVDRPETLDLLQRDSRGLERALQDAGLKTDAGGLSFTLRDDGRRDTGGRQPFGTGNDMPSRASEETARLEPAVAARTVYSNGTLDIRV
jgi:flagellar hook-length control protein FliK